MSPVYQYKAKNWTGETRQGTTNASNMKEATDYLRTQNLVVMDIKMQSSLGGASGESFLENLKKRSPLSKAKSRDYMVFCRQFATMVQAGMAALQSVQILAQQMENAELRERLQEVAISVEKGSPLWEAFDKHSDFFPRILINMIEAGEAGGMLDEVLENLADHFEKQNDLEEKIRSATTYPLVVGVMALGVLALMLFFVLPQFEGIFRDLGMDLPLITRIVLGISGFFMDFWYIFLILIIVGIILLWRYVQTDEGRWRFDNLKLNMPVFGPIYQKTIVARFARTLSTLLYSGVGVLNSLELVERVLNNVVVGNTMQRTREVVQKGQPMAPALEKSGLFPLLLVEMVNVGEETGSLDNMLMRSADFYEKEVAYVMDRLGSIIEPILLIFIGVFVGIMVASIITPMFQMGDFL